MAGCNPVQKFVFPDPIPTFVESVTSEGGPCIPEVVPSEDNCGSLLPTMEGVPDDEALLPVTLQVEASGNDTEAGYTLQGPTGAELGMNDAAFLHQFHTPFAVTTDTNILVRGTSACYHSPTGKLIVIGHHDSDRTLRIRRQDAANVAGTSPYNWTDSVTIDPVAIDAPEPANEPSYIKTASICSAPDGTLLAFYSYHAEDLPSDSTYIAVLKSTDGGDTWQRLHDRINDEPMNPDRSFKVAVSGSWIRVVWVDLATDFVYHVNSQDSGLSWGVNIEWGVSLVQRSFNEDETPYDLAGNGGGQFVLVHTTGGVSTFDTWTYAIAQGDGNFIGIAGVGALFGSRQAINDIVSLSAVSAWGKMYVFVTTSDGGGSNQDDQISAYVQEASQVPQRGPGVFTGGPLEWQPIEPLTGFRGTRHFPQWMTAVNACGRHVFLHSGLWDDVANVREAGSFAARLGDLSPKPLGEYAANARVGRTRSALAGQESDWWASSGATTLGLLWASPVQRPAPVGNSAVSPDSDFVEILTGTGATDYLKNRLEFSGAIGDTAYHEITSTAVASDSWITDGAVLWAICRVTDGSSNVTQSHTLRFSSRVPGGLGDEEVACQLRLGSLGAVNVYDGKAAADKFALFVDMTSWTLIRVAMWRDGSSNRIQVSAFNLNDPAGTFVEGDTTLLQAAAASPEDEVRFGMTGGGNLGTSEWREVGLIRKLAPAQRDLLDVDGSEGTYNYLPIPASRDGTCIGNGLLARWGGGAAAVGDTFEVEACHTYPAENALLDGCIVGWRSGGADPLAAQELILRGGANEGAGAPPRMMLQYVFLCGLEEPEVEVQMSNDPTFTDGSTLAAETLDTREFVGLTVGGVLGHTIRYQDDPARRMPIEGELSGLRVIMTSGAAAGNVYCIGNHCGRDIRLFSENKTNDLQAAGIVGGDTFDVFLPFGIIEYQPSANTNRRRYLRLAFNGTDTCTGDHRLGAILYGCRVDVPIPLEWTHNDEDQPDVQLYEGEGGMSWAYQRGPARRLWVGRVVSDYVRWRESMRYLLRSAAAYAARPILIWPDDENVRSIIYGRWEGSSELENAFWWNQDDGDGEYRFPGGDMAIRVRELP